VSDDDAAPEIEVEVLLRQAATAHARGQVLRARILRRIATELQRERADVWKQRTRRHKDDDFPSAE
jgi:hypothetical protein